MKGKGKVLGMGIDALIPKRSSNLEVVTPKSEVISPNLEMLSDNAGVRSFKSEVAPPESEVPSYNLEALKLAASEAGKNPRISLWLPRSAAVLRYMKKTQPEFSISEEASILLDDAIRRKYPRLMEEIEKLNVKEK
jgi:hypothetical protein